MKKNDSVLRLTTLGLLSAISVIVSLFAFPIFPAAPYLLLDFADIPVLIATVVFGAPGGLAVLFIEAIIQCFVLPNGSGIIGFCMHFIASGAMVVTYALIGKRLPKLGRLAVAVLAGTVVMAAVMVPVSYIFYPMYGIPTEAVTDLLFVTIIPFNLIKAGVNGVLTALLYTFLRPLITKYFSSEKAEK